MARTDSPFSSIKPDARYAKPRLKAGVHPVPGPVGAGKRGAQSALRNPETGRSITLNAAEMKLLDLADGQRDLEALHELQISDDALGPDAVVALFRRLSIMGFLSDVEGADAEGSQSSDRQIDPSPNERSQPYAKSRVGREPGANRVRKVRQGENDKKNSPQEQALTPRRRTAAQSAKAEAALAHPSTKASERSLAATSDAKKKSEAARSEKLLPSSAQKRVPPSRTSDLFGTKKNTGKPSPKPQMGSEVMNTPEANAQAPKVSTSRTDDVDVSREEKYLSEPTKTEDKSSPRINARPNETPRTKDHNAGKADQTAAPSNMNAPDKGPATRHEKKDLGSSDEGKPDGSEPGRSSERKDAPAPKEDAFASITANLSPETPGAAFRDVDLDDAFGGFGGRGEGGRGSGGRLRALMQARQGVGGLGGGGMGQGNTDGGMGMGMGMGMGGGGRRMGAGASPQAELADGPARLPLFNPTFLLKFLYIAGYPLKFILWAIVPVVLLAGMICFQNWLVLSRDLQSGLLQVSRIWLVVLSAGTVNLASRIAQGVAIAAHGGRVRQLGLKAMFGVIPRFYVDTSGIRALDRNGQLWAYGAPLLARLGIFGFGTFLWLASRETGTNFADISLIAANIGLLMFVLSAFPLFPAEGQRWLSIYVGEPQLIPRAILVLRSTFFGKELPPQMAGISTGPYLWFGLAVLISSATGLLTLAGYTFLALERDLGGSGVVVFLGMVSAFLIWLIGLKATIGRRIGRLGDAGAAMGQTATMQPHPLEQLADPSASAATSGVAKVVWAMMIMGSLSLAFLPYNYEAGGTVEILPAARAQAVARTEGEVIEILVSEGSIAEQGQVLARLSSWEQINERNLVRSQLSAAEARLAKLEAGAKPEEIDLAQTRLESALAALRFSENELERSRVLLERGTISAAELERDESSYQSNLSEVATARANLALVKSSATEEELAIARADVEQMTLELEFREAEIERTRIEAPMDGKVVTPDLELRLGGFLRVGETLLEIERTDRVNAAIAIPEADINLIRVGNLVRMKVRGSPDDAIEGTVSKIAPAAEDTGYGRTVRVEATFWNPDDFLRSGTTGYAKIEAREMPVWEAYLRSFRRFFQIEFWSWIP